MRPGPHGKGPSTATLGSVTARIVVPPAAREVVILRWPEEAAEVEQLRREPVPRLLLVEPGTQPPDMCDPLTDWVRLPADERDIEARVRTLRARAPRRDGLRLGPSNCLHRGAERVVLLPVEARMMATFLAGGDGIVSRAELVESVWPGAGRAGRVGPGVRRLRRRVARLGVRIRTVRRVGFRLEILALSRANTPQPQPARH